VQSVELLHEAVLWFFLLKLVWLGGTWVAQSVKCLTLGFGSGSWDLLDILSPFLSAPPPACLLAFAHALSLK